MAEQVNLQEKEGKKYFRFSDGTEALIENEVVNDPAWIGVDVAMEILGLQDRQTRSKMNKLGWFRKYAEINTKPALFLNRVQIEEYAKENPRTTRASLSPSANPKDKVINGSEKDQVPSLESTGRGIITKESAEQIAAVLGPLAPHIKDFVDSHKKDQERLRELQGNEIIREKKITTLTTSLWWGAGVLVVAGVLMWINFNDLSNRVKGLSVAVSSKDQVLASKDIELLQAKTDLLNEKDAELKALRATQSAGQGNK